MGFFQKKPKKYFNRSRGKAIKVIYVLEDVEKIFNERSNFVEISF